MASKRIELTSEDNAVMELIAQEMMNYFGVTRYEFANQRGGKFFRARYMAFYFIRKYTTASYFQIGLWVRPRDPMTESAVFAGVEKVNNNNKLKEIAEFLNKQLLLKLPERRLENP